jgi:hypothetical protein
LSRTVAVPVFGDKRNEVDEVLYLNLSDAVNLVLGDAQAFATISNDDPRPTVSVSDAVVVEGNSGTRSLSFVVHLSEASGRSVTVEYATADDTAAAGSDYVAKSGMLTFLPGAIALTVTVAINGDSLIEQDEAMRLVIAAASNAAIDDGEGQGQILNDDEGGASALHAANSFNADNRAVWRIPTSNADAAIVRYFEELGLQNLMESPLLKHRLTAGNPPRFIFV